VKTTLPAIRLSDAFVLFAERAGKKIDKAMAQAGQAMDKAKDSTKEAVIRTEAAAGDAMDTAAGKGSL
jgi:hypothetical protein